MVLASKPKISSRLASPCHARIWSLDRRNDSTSTRCRISSWHKRKTSLRTRRRICLLPKRTRLINDDESSSTIARQNFTFFLGAEPHVIKPKRGQAIIMDGGRTIHGVARTHPGRNVGQYTKGNFNRIEYQGNETWYGLR